MKNKKIFRFIIVFSVLVLVLSTLFVSAEVVSGDHYVYPFDIQWVEIQLINSDGSVTPITTTVTGNDVNDGRVRCTIKKENGSMFKKNEKYKFLLELHMDYNDDSTLRYYSGEYMVKANYRLSIATSGAINVSANNYAARSDIDYTKVTEDGSFTYNGYNVVTVNYPYSDVGDKYFRYMNSFQVTFNSDVNHTTLNIYAVDFSTLTEQDYYLGEKIDNSTNEITQNQDKNTSEIINNQKENTNKIINGGHDNPSYSGADEKPVDDYIDAEKGLLDSFGDSFDDLIDWFSGFSGNISPGAASGLSVISLCMNDLLNIPQLSMVFKLSLLLGLFSFILGMAQLVVRFNGSNNRRYDSGNKRG